MSEFEQLEPEMTVEPEHPRSKPIENLLGFIATLSALKTEVDDYRRTSRDD